MATTLIHQKIKTNGYFVRTVITEHQMLTRSDIDGLLWKKLPDYMNDTQKKTKIGNLLTELRKKEIIVNMGIYSKPEWHLK